MGDEGRLAADRKLVTVFALLGRPRIHEKDPTGTQQTSLNHLTDKLEDANTEENLMTSMLKLSVPLIIPI